MPRRVRRYIANQPCHLERRGNNREACFIESENYLFYLALWQELSKKLGVSVHAYYLMTNHIRFLVTSEYEDGISCVMRQIGSRYAPYFNKKYKRTAILWEARHKASLIQSEKYLLTCYRYIELNPVRAGMVEMPEEYKWTSYHANARGDISWIEPHDEYRRLGCNSSERCCAYQESFKYQIDSDALHKLRKSAHYCQPLGDDYFAQKIANR